MDTEKKYSSEGRVLRPRRKGPSAHGAGRDGERRDNENRNYGERREGGYRSSYRSSEGGYRNSEGGYRRSEGGYNSNEGGYRREGGQRSGEGGYRGGYRGNSEGGYRHKEGGYRSNEGGYRSNEGGYRNNDGRRREDGGRSGYRSSSQNNYRQRQGGPQKGRGRQPYRRGEVKFTDRDEEGISRMISRKAASDARAMEGRQVVDTFQEEVRLNKFIANSGVCSRREADTYIQAGVVTVNGEVVTELGTKVNVLKDEVRFNGERLKGEEKVYIVMNKPKGYVTTASDPHADKTVMDLLKGCHYRVFPVGRLDKSTTGVLMFTNDGEMAERLTHPSFDKKKIYQVILDHELKQEDYDAILQGITLNDGEIKADELEYIDQTDRRKLGIEIHSGKNRIVRRIFESLGYEVRALDRVYFAGLTKKGLKKGEWRLLTEAEVNILRMGAFL
ncbi:MAG: pseudouridine synthase [Bacteroidales bacterium]|nr:pseudouridine synthase [Bacteroidales bacterium]